MATYNVWTNTTDTLTISSFGAGVCTSNGSGLIASSNSFTVTGSIGAGTTLTAGTGITATTGDILASAGDITITAGNLELPLTTSATVGVVTSGGTRIVHAFGTNNLFAGAGAGNFTLTTAEDNVALGDGVLASLTTGSHCVGLGHQSLIALTEGIYNFCGGSYSGMSLTDADGNVAIGHGSLDQATTSDYSTAVGYNTLGSLGTGDYNSVYGYNAGTSLTLADSSNLLLGNTGTTGDNNTIRIGTQGAGNAQQNRCFVAGVTAVTPAAVSRIMLCDGNGQLGTTAAMTNGQIIIGNTGNTPSVGSLTSAGGTIVITPGAGTINLESAAAVPTTFTTDAGNAIPALGVLNVLGGSNLGTTGAGNTLTVNLDNTVSISGTFDAAGDITSTGGDIVSSAGDVTAGDAITAVNDITSTTGSVVAGDQVTATNNITSTAGNIIAQVDLQTNAGDVVITSGNLELPYTTSVTDGVITVGGTRFIHQYAVAPAADGNAFFGLGAGNMTLTATICVGVGANVFANLQSGVGNTSTGHNSCYLMQQGTGNCAYGYAALRNATICTNNCAFGYSALTNLTTSRGNVAIGQVAMGNFTTPGAGLGFNTAVGYSVLGNALTGVFNSCYGYRSGINYVGSESSNILIGHAGLAGESHHIRIGTTGGGDVQQNKTFIAGITGVTPDAVARVALCDSAGQFGTTAAMTNGQLIIGSTGANPAVATLTSTGATVTITNGAGTINFEAAGSGGVTSWTDDTTTPIALVANTGHTANRGAGNVVYTLPAAAAYGTIIRIAGVQQGWQITQAAGQQILVGNTQTTAGAGGSITSTNARDCIELLCITANTLWTATSLVGNLTIV